MKHARPFAWFVVVPGLLITVSIVFISLTTVRPVAAQCGTSASSCKTCHEVQGADPVNTDGTRWHQSHAFGDFCVFCHAGNQQAQGKNDAHTGMVPPLSDPKAACQSCHSADLNDRVQVYAVLLKETPGNSGGQRSPAAATVVPAQGGSPANAQPTGQPTGQPTVSAPTISAPVASAPTTNEIVVNDPNTVDYVQRYNEIVLGQRPVNWGNITLIALIGLVLVGGGAFGIFNEFKISRAFAATRRVEGEYPAEVVDMLPAIATLGPQTRQTLRNILKHPRKTDKVLNVIDNLVSDEKTEE